MIRERILDDIRDNLIGNQFKRHHLLDKKDINNIEKAYGLKAVRRHADDQTSVLSWISEWKEHPETNPVLFYKLQGDKAPVGYTMCDDDFLLVIQTPFQKYMLQKYGENGVCVDSTHGTNAYDFLLTSVLVVDEFGEGFPAAWCITNHEDFSSLCIFYKEIKNCGKQKLQVVYE